MNGDDAAGLMLAVFGFALVLAYVRGGPAGVRQWLRAKFLNEAGTIPAVRTTAPTVPSGTVLV